MFSQYRRWGAGASSRGLARRLPWVLAAVAASAGFCALGLWQLGRAQEKERLLERHRLALAAPPLSWAEAERRLALPDMAWRELLPLRVVGAGHFDPSRSLIHDHRIHRGRAGVHFLTLFRPAGGAMSVLVNLGWTDFDRLSPRLPPLPEGEVVIEGLLVAPPAVGLSLAQPSWQPGRIPLLLHLDIEALAAQMGERLAPAVLLLDAGAPFGLLREWPALPNTLPPERHRGYALQWFGMAAAVLVITIALMRRRHV